MSHNAMPATTPDSQLADKRRLSTAQGGLGPHSYFEELAEMGSLQSFLDRYMHDEFHSNHEFRKLMLGLMLDYCAEEDQGLEKELMGDLSRALQHFYDKAATCMRNLP